MTKPEALKNLTTAAKEAQNSGSNESEIYNAVRLDCPLDPRAEGLSKKPAPEDPTPRDPNNPLSGFGA
jgi:hypothetical protein